MAVETETLNELLEAALSELEEGVAILDDESRILFWNPAAAAITGFLSAHLLGHLLPSNFFCVDAGHSSGGHAHLQATMLPALDETPEETRIRRPDRPILVQLAHNQGHTLPAMLRRTALRNAAGKRFGVLLRFHPVEEIDSLPHGSVDEDGGHGNRVQESQTEMEGRLDEAWHEWTTNAVPFGLLWITVDQAAMLRKTHGRDASETMLAILERTLLHGLRPVEVLGRWGVNEFLVVCHERTEEALLWHAHHLAGLARTADFRWWGDRVSLTISAGAAQAAELDPANQDSSNMQTESLRCLLRRAQKGAQESQNAGGNRVTFKPRQSTGGAECSQS